MTTDRRMLMRVASGVPALMLGLTNAPATQAAAPSLEPLRAAGLDPLIAYRKMFAGLSPQTGCCWWYLGAQPRLIPDIGAVPVSQVIALMGFGLSDIDKDAFNIRWNELVSARDIATGGPATSTFDAVTGQSTPRPAVVRDGPGLYTVRRADAGLSISLEQTGARVEQVQVGATIEGDRLCLTQTEEKVRTMAGGEPRAILTTLQIYASLAEVKGSALSAKAAGFYSVKVKSTGLHSVVGLMRKAEMDEKLNPIAWDWMKQAYPDFFDGERVASI